MIRKRTNAFTLTELLVAVAVLAVVILLVSHLISSASTLTNLATKHIESDGQVRQLFDRMAIDFAQMVKRSDVDFYGKGTTAGGPMTGSTLSTINDRIAFFTMVPGDYPSTGSPSPFSLVSYKVNSSTAVANAAVYTRLQRMARGLLMNGDSSANNGSSPSITDGPIVFAPITISSVWSTTVTSNATTDSKHEIAGPQVFRFEYYYLLTSGALSVIPWDPSIGHSDPSGMRDVAAIVADVATIDSKSHVLLTNSDVATIAGTLVDYSAGTGHGAGWLLNQWQSVIDTPTNPAVRSMPKAALSGVRVYEHSFYLAPTLQ
jgi:prepilin-type N-terminal cleavage/methylation domain-containing protein